MQQFQPLCFGAIYMPDFARADSFTIFFTRPWLLNAKGETIAGHDNSFMQNLTL
jgi:hypothetical protein